MSRDPPTPVAPPSAPRQPSAPRRPSIQLSTVPSPRNPRPPAQIEPQRSTPPIREPETTSRRPPPPPPRQDSSKPTPSPKRPSNQGPPSRLPVFSFFPQIHQGVTEDEPEFLRSNIESRPKTNNPTRQNNKGRQNPSKQRGNPSTGNPNSSRIPPKESSFETDFPREQPRRTTAAPPPPPPPRAQPPRAQPSRGRGNQQNGQTPFTAFNNFPQFPRTPEPQVEREPEPTNNANLPPPRFSPQPTQPVDSRRPTQDQPVFQSRFPPLEPVRPQPQQRPRPTFGVFESVQLQTGGQLQTPIRGNVPQEPLPPPPSAPRQPPAFPSPARPIPRPQSGNTQGLVNNVVIHDSGSQSSSFFSFNRPNPQTQQPQFNNDQSAFVNRFQSPPPTPPAQQPQSFVRFEELNQQQSGRAPQQQFSSFIQDFDQSSFDFRGVPQQPRFSARPNPVSNQQFSRQTPQTAGTFDSERPQRTQRALPPSLSGEEDTLNIVPNVDSPTKASNDEEKAEEPKKGKFSFPDAEFGGFIPVGPRNRRMGWSDFFL